MTYEFVELVLKLCLGGAYFALAWATMYRTPLFEAVVFVSLAFLYVSLALWMPISSCFVAGELTISSFCDLAGLALDL